MYFNNLTKKSYDTDEILSIGGEDIIIRGDIDNEIYISPQKTIKISSKSNEFFHITLHLLSDKIELYGIISDNIYYPITFIMNNKLYTILSTLRRVIYLNIIDIFAPPETFSSNDQHFEYAALEAINCYNGGYVNILSSLYTKDDNNTYFTNIFSLDETCSTFDSIENTTELVLGTFKLNHLEKIHKIISLLNVNNFINNRYRRDDLYKFGNEIKIGNEIKLINSINYSNKIDITIRESLIKLLINTPVEFCYSSFEAAFVYFRVNEKFVVSESVIDALETIYSSYPYNVIIRKGVSISLIFKNYAIRFNIVNLALSSYLIY